MQLCRQFKRFYGPNEDEIRDYLRENKIKEDIKLDYINLIIDYYFVQRQKLKDRSTLHRLLLLKEETQDEIDILKKYLKKFKPLKLKEEGFE